MINPENIIIKNQNNFSFNKNPTNLSHINNHKDKVKENNIENTESSNSNSNKINDNIYSNKNNNTTINKKTSNNFIDLNFHTQENNKLKSNKISEFKNFNTNPIFSNRNSNNNKISDTPKIKNNFKNIFNSKEKKNFSNNFSIINEDFLNNQINKINPYNSTNKKLKFNSISDKNLQKINYHKYEKNFTNVSNVPLLIPIEISAEFNNPQISKYENLKEDVKFSDIEILKIKNILKEKPKNFGFEKNSLGKNILSYDRENKSNNLIKNFKKNLCNNTNTSQNIQYNIPNKSLQKYKSTAYSSIKSRYMHVNTKRNNNEENFQEKKNKTNLFDVNNFSIVNNFNKNKSFNNFKNINNNKSANIINNSVSVHNKNQKLNNKIFFNNSSSNNLNYSLNKEDFLNMRNTMNITNYNYFPSGLLENFDSIYKNINNSFSNRELTNNILNTKNRGEFNQNFGLDNNFNKPCLDFNAFLKNDFLDFSENVQNNKLKSFTNINSIKMPDVDKYNLNDLTSKILYTDGDVSKKNNFIKNKYKDLIDNYLDDNLEM